MLGKHQYTQKNDVLQHLKKHNSITQIEALNLYGSLRLSAIIFELRKAGYKIKTRKESNSRNSGKHARYELVQEVAA